MAKSALSAPHLQDEASRVRLCRSASLAAWPGLLALWELRRRAIGRLNGENCHPGPAQVLRLQEEVHRADLLISKTAICRCTCGCKRST